MRTIVALIVFAIIHTSCFAQLFDSDFKKITNKNKRLAKRLLKKNCSKVADVRHLDYMPISAFLLSHDAISYDSTKRIIDFLSPNKKIPIDHFFTFRKGEYEGTMDFAGQIYFDEKMECSYDDSKVFKKWHTYFIALNVLEELKKHNYDFLFAVKYFKNGIWFVEDNRVFILDIFDLKVYDPDDYIMQKCSPAVIRNLAAGKSSRFCQ